MTPNGKLPKGDEGDFDDASDRQWFQRLAGQLHAADDARALSEADALKRAIRLQAQQPEAPLDAALEERKLQELLFRMRRERLLEEPATRSKWLTPVALAASVIVAVILLRPLVPGHDPAAYDEPPVMRGEPRTVMRKDDQPRLRAEALSRELTQAGIAARVYQKGDVFYVDTDVPPERIEEAAQVLSRLGIENKPGQLRIEINRP